MWKFQGKNPTVAAGGCCRSRCKATVILSPFQWDDAQLPPCVYLVFPLSFTNHPLSSIMADLRTVNELLAGSVGGAAQVLVGQPLDTVKTRAQVAPRECRLSLSSKQSLIVCDFTTQGICLCAFPCSFSMWSSLDNAERSHGRFYPNSAEGGCSCLIQRWSVCVHSLCVSDPPLLS